MHWAPNARSPGQPKPVVQEAKPPALAVEIAEALNDVANIDKYCEAVEDYDENLLREAVEAAVRTPDEKIRHSRRALYFYILRQLYEKNRNQ